MDGYWSWFEILFQELVLAVASHTSAAVTSRYTSEPLRIKHHHFLSSFISISNASPIHHRQECNLFHVWEIWRQWFYFKFVLNPDLNVLKSSDKILIVQNIFLISSVLFIRCLSNKISSALRQRSTRHLAGELCQYFRWSEAGAWQPLFIMSSCSPAPRTAAPAVLKVKQLGRRGAAWCWCWCCQCLVM